MPVGIIGSMFNISLNGKYNEVVNTDQHVEAGPNVQMKNLHVSTDIQIQFYMSP